MDYVSTCPDIQVLNVILFSSNIIHLCVISSFFLFTYGYLMFLLRDTFPLCLITSSSQYISGTSLQKLEFFFKKRFLITRVSQPHKPAETFAVLKHLTSSIICSYVTS